VDSAGAKRSAVISSRRAGYYLYSPHSAYFVFDHLHDIVHCSQAQPFGWSHADFELAIVNVGRQVVLTNQTIGRNSQGYDVKPDDGDSKSDRKSTRLNSSHGS